MIKLRGVGRTINHTISSDTTDIYDLWSQINYPAGGPTDVVTVNLTVNSGVVVKHGLYINSFAVGSKVKITNLGTIAGRGGAGGVGGRYLGTYYPYYFPGTDGAAGGDAIYSTVPLTIDNGSGYIYGGGGGGGGGSSFVGESPPYYYGNVSCTTQSPSNPHYDWEMGSGGGGGGRGYNNAGGGAPNSGGYWQGGATSGSYSYGTQILGSNSSAGSYGVAGSSTGAGAGGAGGVGTDSWDDGIGTYFTTVGKDGGAGGAGGDWGQAGTTGSGTSYSYSNPSAGGAAGYAVKTNGAGVTWLSGNDGTRVKGLVN
jgi:hypothetical protein